MLNTVFTYCIKPILYTLGTIITYITLVELYRWTHLIYYYKLSNKHPNLRTSYESTFRKLGNLIYNYVTKNDMLYFLRKKLTHDLNKGIDLIATTSFTDPLSCDIAIVSENAMKEFFAKELQYTIKPAPFANRFLGFFFENGDLAMKKRHLFSEVFVFDKLVAMIPDLRNIIRGHIDKLKCDIMATKEKKLAIKFKYEIMTDIFNEVSDYLLFGPELEGEKTQVDQKPIANSVKQMFQYYIDFCYSLINTFTFGLASKLNFSPHLRRLIALQIKVHESITKKWERRYREISSGGSSGQNVIDIMV